MERHSLTRSRSPRARARLGIVLAAIAAALVVSSPPRPPPNRRRRVPSSTAATSACRGPSSCGHIMVPVRARRPGARHDQGRLRDPPSSRPPATEPGDDLRDGRRPRLRVDREALRQLADRRARPDPPPPRPRPLRHARHRPLRRDRLPGPAGGADPGIDRDRRVRQPARPELRRLHLGRSRRRHEPAPPRPRPRQDLLLRRLLRDVLRPGLRGPPPGHACAA